MSNTTDTTAARKLAAEAMERATVEECENCHFGQTDVGCTPCSNCDTGPHSKWEPSTDLKRISALAAAVTALCDELELRDAAGKELIAKLRCRSCSAATKRGSCEGNTHGSCWGGHVAAVRAAREEER
jgi:hypothetical protein